MSSGEPVVEIPLQSFQAGEGQQEPELLAPARKPGVFNFNSRPKSAKALAARKAWLHKITDPKKRLIAATAYRSFPDQSDNEVARANRYTAALKALGYPTEKCAGWAQEFVNKSHKKRLKYKKLP